MSKRQNESNRPTHAIWHVQGEGDKARWQRIGAAWLHGDKKGANLKLDYAPTTPGGRMVVREITEQNNGSDTMDAADIGGQQ